MKYGDSRTQDSILLKAVTGKSNTQSRIDEAGWAQDSEVYKVGVTRSGSRRWRKEQSPAGENDGSILAHDKSGEGPMPPGMVIVRTTEVNVTR